MKLIDQKFFNDLDEVIIKYYDITISLDINSRLVMDVLTGSKQRNRGQ